MRAGQACKPQLGQLHLSIVVPTATCHEASNMGRRKDMRNNTPLFGYLLGLRRACLMRLGSWNHRAFVRD
jgi:hypothetical protein